MSVSEFGSSVVSTSREGSPMSNTVNGSSQDSGVFVHREGRRPSIAEMISSGEIFRHQGDLTDHLDFSGVPVGYVEQIYNDFERPNSEVDSNDEGQCRGISEDSVLSVDEVVPNTSCFRRGRWWNINPTFGSPIIESYWKRKVIEFLRRRYKITVSFIGLFALVWVVFFSINVPFPLAPEDSSDQLALYSVKYSQWYILGAAMLLVSMFILLTLTFSRHYPKCAFVLSLVLAFILMVCSWALPVAIKYNDAYGVSTVSFVAQFAITALVILVMYTLSRLPLSLSTGVGVAYIIILEALISKFAYVEKYASLFHQAAASRCMFYVCLIVAGLTTAYLSQARLRATFRKIAQCVLSEKALELEKQLAETTILTMMPKQFAEELSKLEVQLAFILKQQAAQQEYTQQYTSPWLQSIPTPFTVRSVDNVSILFADIVGFTQLSSKMRAVELVSILDEIFSKFDELVTEHHCEKVNTLGDCYFCVSGCPEPAITHADNCVHMGLAILEALKNFRAKTTIPIEMRIGIHTGSVLCGVMGNKRFKFDVWSKDVSIATKIEALCLPGHVLISETTRTNLHGSFHLEELSLSNPVTLTEQLRLFTVHGLTHILHLTNVEEYGMPASVDTLSVLELQQSSTHTPQPGITARLARICCHRKQEEELVEIELRPVRHSDSIVDIFSRQSQIQQCRSYADLSVGTAIGDAARDSDRRIVQLMEEGNVDFENYFNRYLKLLSLHFHNSDLEKIYHNHGRDLDDGSGGEMAKLGLRLSKQSYLMDTCALLFIFVMVMGGTAITVFSEKSFQTLFLGTWLGLFIFGLAVELTVICHVIVVFRPNWFPSRLVRYADRIIMNWYVRSTIALFFIYYPMAAVFVSISYCSLEDLAVINLTYVQTSLLVTIIVLVSSILFMDISHIAKMIFGGLSCIVTVVMTSAVQPQVCSNIYNNSALINNYYSRHLAPESAILLFLILLILTVVNRMSEVSVRVSFLGCVEAAARRSRTRQLKSQAEWLLHNIIPPHVARRLREVGHFSQNHECVGVLFASIVNFNEYYQQRGETEESYRVLNRIVSKFDSLLDLPRFQSVEKIKTIGSIYMAASGLNLPEDTQCGVDHLVTLIDFAIQLEEVLKTINSQTVGFAFSLRVGFNYGSVTSGVVGRRKMLYDIWGDVVNVASRMESTGLKAKIQMPEQCLALLSPFVVQLGNRTVQVKGKGDMRTVFVTRCS